MAITKEKKGQILEGLEEKFSKATAIYFAENKGLTVKELSTLRKKLREQGVDFVVAKKTLMKLAAKNQNLPEISDDVITGPVGAAFGYDDVVAPSKIINQFASSLEKSENLELLGGILEGKLIGKAEALQMANLPSKEELLAKLVGSMKAPISGFHGTLHGLLSKFVRTVDAVRATKS